MSHAVLLVSPDGYAPSPSSHLPHTISFANSPIRLQGPARLAFSVNHHYRIVRSGSSGPWRVQTAAYFYEFEDPDGREVLAFHWHPETVPEVPQPHLHINRGVVPAGMITGGTLLAGRNPLRPDIAAAHIPTSRIALEQVVEMAILQFGVPPLRNDWQHLLQTSLNKFERTQSWSITSPTGQG